MRRTLASIKPGEKAVIVQIPDSQVRAQAVRFGIYEGAQVKCCGVIPGGPVLLENGRAQYALGRKLAEKVMVGTMSERRS